MLRDCSGSFLGAQAHWHDHCLYALMMEAMACKEGLELARRCGVQRVHLETDCLEFVRLWELGDMQRATIQPVIQVVKELSSCFLGFRISHISRDCNRVAHELAKQVSSSSRSGEWRDETPGCVRNLLEQDCNHLH